LRGKPQPVDHPVDYFAAAAVPPVAILGSVGLKLVVPVHPGQILS
jgi:hypothetical protein